MSKNIRVERPAEITPDDVINFLKDQRTSEGNALIKQYESGAIQIQFGRSASVISDTDGDIIVLRRTDPCAEIQDRLAGAVTELLALKNRLPIRRGLAT